MSYVPNARTKQLFYIIILLPDDGPQKPGTCRS